MSQSISQMAQAYETPKLRNIAELDAVSCEAVIEEKTFPGKDGEWSALVITSEGTDYRVPKSVLAKLKTLQEVKPKMKSFRVMRTGEGLNTDYSVVDLS